MSEGSSTGRRAQRVDQLRAAGESLLRILGQGPAYDVMNLRGQPQLVQLDRRGLLVDDLQKGGGERACLERFFPGEALVKDAAERE